MPIDILLDRDRSTSLADWYNIWRLTDFLLKADVDGETDYAPILTAGECVELIASALISPD